MKITELRAENVKRLKAVHITPNGEAAVILGGRNEQGKTSVLDAIEMALAGSDSVPEMPIRNGEERARIVVKTEEYVVERRFTRSNSYLTVTNAKGLELASPQKVLDKLVGSLSFDPLAFARMDPKAQAEEVKRLAGLDFDGLDTEKQRAFDQRTELNREVKRLEGALAKMPHHDGAPAHEVAAADALAELRRIADQRNARSLAEVSLQDMRAHARRLADEIEAIEKQLEAKRVTLEGVREAGRVKREEFDAMPVPDAAREQQLEAMVRGADEINAKVRANAERLRLSEELDTQTVQVMKLTGRLQAIEREKSEALAAAKLPIDGLGFDEALGLLVDGVPFAQCSSARKLKVSVALGLAANPTLKVLLIRDGAFLDEESLAMVAKMAADAGAQVWVERVGKGAECSVIIEDGQVEGAAPETEEPVSAVRGKRVSAKVAKEEPGAAG